MGISLRRLPRRTMKAFVLACVAVAAVSAEPDAKADPYTFYNGLHYPSTYSSVVRPSFGLNYHTYSPYTAGVYSPFVHSIAKREAEPKADADVYHSVYSPTTYTLPGYTGYTGYSGLTYPTYSPYTAGVYSPFVHSIGKREAEPAADADAALYHSVYSPTTYTFPGYTGYTGYSGYTGYTAPRVYSNLFNNFYHHY